MKRGLILVALGLLGLMVQGSMALVVPARFVPDLGLLLVVAIALCLRSVAGGLALSALIGFVTDLLSVSLLGQHALLRMGVFAAARFSSARLNLRGPLPQAVFVTVLSTVHAAALWVLVAFVAPEVGSRLVSPAELLPHALINGLLAPVVTFAVGRLLARVGDDEGVQRLVRFQPRKFSP